MTTYTPEQTTAWSQTDLDALAGKTITLVIEGYLVGNRPVRRAGFDLGSTFTFEFVGGGSWTVGRADPEVQITVHD